MSRHRSLEELEKRIDELETEVRTLKDDRDHREQNFLKQIMETSPVGITVVDREGRISLTNARAEAILGRNAPIFTAEHIMILHGRSQTLKAMIIPPSDCHFGWLNVKKQLFLT
ncbi:MAG: PAS domain S-box protein [Deltaproteobacteria bacterium]|nr:PAS domain S-box protein [Deltaproteobacteria bacterium]